MIWCGRDFFFRPIHAPLFFSSILYLHEFFFSNSLRDFEITTPSMTLNLTTKKKELAETADGWASSRVA